MKTLIRCLMLCLFLTGVNTIVLAGREFAVDPSTDSQELPDIDRSIVVWQEYVSTYGDYDIFGIDLESSSGYIYIVDWANDQIKPRVWAQRVTWQDDYYGDGTDYDIYMSDISNSSGILLYPVTAMEDITETNAEVHGNTVVWQNNAGTEETPDWDIFTADMTEPNAPYIHVVDTYSSNQTNPALYRNRVVYQDDTGANQDIWSADIWMKKAPVYDAVIVDELAALDQANPAVWGDTIVWQTDIGGGDHDIYAADISDPANQVIFVVTNNPASQANPDISRHIVVWQDSRNGDWDIYGYNLVTQKEFRITDNAADQTHPAISGDTVVWQDNRSGVSNIYAVYLDAVDIADCPVPPAGDTDRNCRVDIADFVKLAQNWLACSLEPIDACAN